MSVQKEQVQSFENWKLTTKKSQNEIKMNENAKIQNCYNPDSGTDLILIHIF